MHQLASHGSALPRLVLLVLAITVLVVPAASAAAPTLPTKLTLTTPAPASAKAGLAAPFTAVLTDVNDALLPGASVTLQRLDTAWATVGSGTTDAAGRVVVNAAVPAGTTRWRAAYAGDPTYAAATSAEEQIAWRSTSHPVVRIWRAHGFRWTYGNKDSQHVDGRGTPSAGSFTG